MDQRKRIVRHHGTEPRAGSDTKILQLKITLIRDSTNQANAELLEWCGPWDPEAFDLESVNRRL